MEEILIGGVVILLSLANRKKNKGYLLRRELANMSPARRVLSIEAVQLKEPFHSKIRKLDKDLNELAPVHEVDEGVLEADIERGQGTLGNGGKRGDMSGRGGGRVSVQAKGRFTMNKPPIYQGKRLYFETIAQLEADGGFYLFSDSNSTWAWEVWQDMTYGFYYRIRREKKEKSGRGNSYRIVHTEICEVCRDMYADSQPQRTNGRGGSSSRGLQIYTFVKPDTALPNNFSNEILGKVTG